MKIFFGITGGLLLFLTVGSLLIGRGLDIAIVGWILWTLFFIIGRNIKKPSSSLVR